MSISTRIDVVPPTGVAQVTAVVTDQAGSPAPDGTPVQFTTTLGRVEPAQATTVLGVATTTFSPSGAAGVADVRAQAGSAVSSPLQLSVGTTSVNVALGAVDLGGINALATATVTGAEAVRYEWYFERGANPEVVTTANQARYQYPLPGFKDLTVRVTLADGRRVLGSAAVILQ